MATLDSALKRPIAELQAGDEFRKTLVPRADATVGLAPLWHGFVWMNPPFGRRGALAPWLAKFVMHRNGVCLVPDRTSAPWWQDYMPRMDLTLQVAKKIKFIGRDGKPGKSPAQGTTLGAIGARGVEALYRAEQRGLGTVWQRPAHCGVAA